MKQTKNPTNQPEKEPISSVTYLSLEDVWVEFLKHSLSQFMTLVSELFQVLGFFLFESLLDSMRQFTTLFFAQTEQQKDITRKGLSSHSADLIKKITIKKFWINLENDTKSSQQHVLARMCFEGHVVLYAECTFTAKCFEMDLSCRVMYPFLWFRRTIWDEEQNNADT